MAQSNFQMPRFSTDRPNGPEDEELNGLMFEERKRQRSDIEVNLDKRNDAIKVNT